MLSMLSAAYRSVYVAICGIRYDYKTGIPLSVHKHYIKHMFQYDYSRGGVRLRQQTVFDKEGYCVCCPKCGKVLSRSLSTNSELRCDRCGFLFYAHVKTNTVFITNAKYAAGDEFWDRMREYEKWTDRFTGSDVQ